MHLASDLERPSLLIDPAAQVAVIAPSGDLDETTAPAFREVIQGAIERGARDLVLDCAQLSGISSVGVGSIVLGYRKYGQERGRIVAARCSAGVESVFRMAGLESRLVFYSDVDSACSSLIRTEVRIFEPVAENCAAVRRWLHEIAGQGRLEPDDCHSIEAAVSEAFTNAVEYACASPEDRIVITTRLGSALTVDVHDPGPGFQARRYISADPESLQLDTRGLGIHLMRNLMDRVEFIVDEPAPEDGSTGTTVRLVKYLRPVSNRSG